jgi:predicted transcriptional regulator
MSSARGEIAGEQAKQMADSELESIDHLSFSVGSATRPMPPMIESSWSVEQMTHQGLPENSLTSMPVARQGELIGFVLRQDLDAVQLEDKGHVTIGEIMNPESLRVISTDESFREALRSLDRHRLNQLVVMDADYVVGIVTREDIVRALLTFKAQGMQAESMDSDTRSD